MNDKTGSIDTSSPAVEMAANEIFRVFWEIFFFFLDRFSVFFFHMCIYGMMMMKTDESPRRLCLRVVISTASRFRFGSFLFDLPLLTLIPFNSAVL